MSVTLYPVWRRPVSTKSSAATIGCLVAKRKSPSSTSYLFLSTSNMCSHSPHFDYSARCACCGTHCRITECSECQSLTQWNGDNFGRLYMFSLGLSVRAHQCRTVMALIRRRHACSSGTAAKTEDLLQTNFINSHWLIKLSRVIWPHGTAPPPPHPRAPHHLGSTHEPAHR